MGVAPLPFFHIPGLQLFLPTKRTILLDSTRYGMETEARWTAEIRCPTDAICPLGRLLRATEIRPAPSSPQPEAEIYLYARVGTEDAFAFPDLLAGSVVRIDKREPDLFCHFETASQAASSSWLNTPTEWSAVGFAARTRGESHFIRRNCRTPKSATWRTDFAGRSSRRTSLSLPSQYRTD